MAERFYELLNKNKDKLTKADYNNLSESLLKLINFKENIPTEHIGIEVYFQACNVEEKYTDFVGSDYIRASSNIQKKAKYSYSSNFQEELGSMITNHPNDNTSKCLIKKGDLKTKLENVLIKGSNEDAYYISITVPQNSQIKDKVNRLAYNPCFTFVGSQNNLEIIEKEIKQDYIGFLEKIAKQNKWKKTLNNTIPNLIKGLDFIEVASQK